MCNFTQIKPNIAVILQLQATFTASQNTTTFTSILQSSVKFSGQQKIMGPLP